MEKNFRKLKLVTASFYADIYVHDGETDQAEGLVMTPNHMLRQEHQTEHDKEYILVFHEDGKLDALFHRLHPKDLPQQENGDVVMWDVIAEYVDFDFPVEVDLDIDDDNPFRIAEIRAQQ